MRFKLSNYSTVFVKYVLSFLFQYTNEWKPIIEKAKADDSHTGTLADDEEMDPEKLSNKVSKILKKINKFVPKKLNISFFFLQVQIKLTGPLLDEHTDTFVQAVHILWNIWYIYLFN